MRSFENEKLNAGLASGLVADRQACATRLPEPPAAGEIPRLLGEAMDRSEILSSTIARLEFKLQSVLQIPTPASDGKQSSAATELGCGLAALGAREQLMIEAVESLIARLEL